MTSLVSQPLIPTRHVKEGGVKLETMPDYLNSVTKEKLSKLPEF